VPTPFGPGRDEMDDKKTVEAGVISRDQLAALLNEDLSREYQAIIAYVVYSQVLKGPEYMSIADQLETHAHEEVKHALVLSRQIDYLGQTTVTPKPVRTSDKPKEMLRFDLDNENDTIRNYRIASVSAKRSANTRLRSKSGRFSSTNRITRST